MIDGIVEFVQARLDDQERIAHAAAEAFLHGDRVGIDPYAMHPSVRMHVYSWTPARVLREIQAKRRILTEVVAQIDGMDQQIISEWGSSQGEPDESHLLLRLLAAPYDSHPDYRPEWSTS